MTVAMYLRKSRAEELSDSVDETLKRHKETLLEFAQKNNLKIEHIYEEVVSGESLYARPQMLQLLADVENDKYDAVLCMDIDRLGRGAMSDQGVILETFKGADTKIITPRKIYDLNNEMDEEYTEFETFMARRELKMIKRRMQRGVKKTVEDGGYIANAPYGYTKATVDKRPTLAINEEEARFVRLMFDMYVNEGKGCQIIADTINSMGAKPHRSQEFGRTSVMHILRNYTFIGKVVWNQKTHIRKNGKNTILYNPRDKWIIVDGLHPAIVDEETFYKAQEIFEGRYHAPSNKGIVENPLAGLVFCKNCGAPMQRQVLKQNSDDYLLCQKKGCIVASKLGFVENTILDILKQELIRLEAAGKTNTETETVKNYSEALKSIDDECKTIEHQKSKLHDLLEQEVYDIDTFLARQNLLNEKLQKLTDARNAIEAKAAPKRLNTQAMIDKIRSVLESYGSANAQEKNILLKSVIENVSYYKEKGFKPAEFVLEINLKPIHF